MVDFLVLPYLKTRRFFGCLRFVLGTAAAAAIIGGLFASPPAAIAATSGQNGTHDPSRMIESDGRFYVYSTGGGSKSSPDGLVWTSGPPLFPNGIPKSATSVVTGNQGVWAPDVIFFNGLYFVFYSIASSGSDCAVGVLTTPTLNPSSPNYNLMDRGVVVSNKGSATYCAIDPAPAIDASGNLWVSYGSGYSKSSSDNTIYVTRLDNSTGLASSTDSAKPGHALEPGHIEASYIHYHSGYYYLFWNSGGCCDGPSSTYLIHVARAQSITGPYSGTRNFYGSNGSIHGPGHIGIYDNCGTSRFTYHYYPDTGNAVLGENELTWGSDGWPVAGLPSSTPLTPCGATGNGGATGMGAGGTTGGGRDAGVTDATSGAGGRISSGGAQAPGSTGGNSSVSGGGPGTGVTNTGGAVGSSGGAVGSGSGGANAGTGNGTGGHAASSGGASGASSGGATSGGGCSVAHGADRTGRCAVGFGVLAAAAFSLARRVRRCRRMAVARRDGGVGCGPSRSAS